MAGAAVRSELVAGDRSLQPGEMAASVANATSARDAPVRRRAPRGLLAGAPRQYDWAMSFDETLAARVRQILADRTDVVEKKMFGGLCFMVNGAMCCGLTKTDFRGGCDDR